jgi:hypothetical protein
MALPKPKIFRNVANPIETATGAGSDFIVKETGKATKEVKKQFDGFHEDFFSQLLGLDFGGETTPKKRSMAGDMKAGEEISFKATAIEASVNKVRNNLENPNILPAIDYRREIIQNSERLSRSESRELDKRIQDITEELKRLVDSSSLLSAQFVEVSVQKAPTNAGKYHMHFFEWLLIEIRKIRMQLEDSGAWLSVMKSKKGQQKYGNMAKKHGTSFTLSGERSTATQTG